MKWNENDTMVLETVAAFGPCAREFVVLITGIPRTTVYDALRRLILNAEES